MSKKSVARGPLGPFTVAPGPFLLGGPADHSYAGRLVEWGGRRWLMTWTDVEHGRFVGALGDPLPIEVRADGSLLLLPSAADDAC